VVTADSSLFEQRTSELRACVDVALARYATFASGCPAPLAEAIRYSLLAPGKRLRPILVLLGAEACGGTLQAALPAACAVEMVHAYSLIHDDLPAMDDDDLRRGLPTCHKKFGEATAILAGDALLALAFEVLAKGIQPAETAAACCAALAEAAGACQLVGGQADDLVAGRDGGGLELLESIHRRKTGAMMLVSLRLGAMTAAADTARTAALERYGHALGLAFQITDDLLDVRGNASEVGKRLGKDQRQGKLTFPGLLGADESARRAAVLVEEACEALKPLGPQAACLAALARYVLRRNR
jgi:geranylgeranyl diphosphate synthase type II